MYFIIEMREELNNREQLDKSIKQKFSQSQHRI